MDQLRQAAQEILRATEDIQILTPREWQAVHDGKVEALRAALAEQPKKPQEPETLAEALYRYGTDFMCHPVSRGIGDIEEAGCLMIEASKRLAEPPSEQEPYCYTYTENGEEYFAPPTAYVPDDAKPLYTAPQPVKREPLTQQEVVDGFCKTPHQVQYVAVFDAGVRFAERAHGIGGQT